MRLVTGSRASGGARWPTRLRNVAAVAATCLVAALLAAAPATAAAPCQDTSSATGGYTVRVCLTEPATGQSVTGKIPVTATFSVVSGSSPGIQRMVFTLNGQYVLTDYQSPYTFTLDTGRFVDGAYTLAAHALLRDASTTTDATVELTFANGITSPPVNTKTFTPAQGKPAAAGDPYVVAAAGDGAGGDASETAVNNLIAGMNPNLLLYLGDVYEKGTPTEFDNWYGPEAPGNTFYGRFRSITLPVVGNHEFEGNQAPGYFDYWDNPPHYYSVDRHGWHLIALDANSAFGQTAAGTGQYNWLQNDLAGNTQPCTLVFYHQARWNIGDEGPSLYLDPFWKLFAQYGVDLVVNGHDHTYQRWEPLDGDGNPSPTGVTELIDGAGGHATGGFPSSDSRVAASFSQFGAIQLKLNAGGAGYSFKNTSGSTLDSGSVKCDPTASDTVSPTAPTSLTATSVYKTRIDLSWTAATDNVGVTRYEIYRDGALLDTIGAATSYSDNTVTAGSTHTYTVRAVDDAGNKSPDSNAATATTPSTSVLFHDGFETGDLSLWTNPAATTNPPNSGLVAEQSDVFAGGWAAESKSTGGGASAWHVLDQPESALSASLRFKVIGSHSSTVNLLRMRNGAASSGPIATVGLSSTNRLTLRPDGGASPATVTSGTSVSAGAWHALQLRIQVNGTSSTTQVTLDGNVVPDLSLSTDLGTSPVAKLEIGDPGSATTAKSWDVAFDEVAYDRDSIGDLGPPTAPTGLTAQVSSNLAVDLSWKAASDDVAVTGYDIYRDGTRIDSVGSVTSYRDATVKPGTSYTYQVKAKDAAGNTSAFSNSVVVQTSEAFTDGFESGDLSKWSTVNGLTVSQQDVDTGSWAARASSTGAAASAQATIASPSTDLYYRVRFKLESALQNNVNLLRFRTPTNGAIATAYVTSAGKLGYRNDVAGTTNTTGTVVSTGTWHELQLHAQIADTAGKVELYLDGQTAVSQTEALGTTPIGKVELGDPSTGRTFDVAFDNVVVNSSQVQDVSAPTAPANLTTTGTTKDSVTLGWDPASDDVGVVGYRVYRNGTAITKVSGSDLSYTDTGLPDGTTYSYAVTAVDAVGHESPPSNTVSASTSDATVPTSPTNLTASAAAGKVDLAWSAATDNTGVTGYRVYRDDLTQPLATIGPVLSYTDSTVASGTAYTYRVSAFDKDGNESDKSAPATVTSIDTVAPTAPATPTAMALSDVSAQVTWTASTDAGGVVGYDVYRNGSATPVGSVSGSSLSYTDTGVTADSPVSYTVKARDAAGNVSPDSATASTRTWVFGDGFESGDFRRWTNSTAIQATTLQAFSGSYGAEAASQKTNAAYAVRTLPSTYSDLYYDLRFKMVTGKSANTDVLRFRTASGTNLLSLYYSDKKMLALQNDVSNTPTVSNVAVPVGIWQEAQVHLVVNGTSSKIEVWFNGNPVTALTTTANLGTVPIGQVVAGETTTGRSYDFAVDDVRVTRTR